MPRIVTVRGVPVLGGAGCAPAGAAAPAHTSIKATAPARITAASSRATVGSVIQKPAKRTGRGLRVIAGEVGGLRLAAPPDVRPTTDRAREALFSSLGATVEEVAVLDLFAGSGALAIEALSRGAAFAVLVEQDRTAADACRQNLETTHLTSRARVQATPVATFLERGPGLEAPFGLVVCDPPYSTPADQVAAVLAHLAEPGWLAPDAVVVVERQALGGPPEPEAWWPAGWQVRWERRYGDTLLFALLAPLSG